MLVVGLEGSELTLDGAHVKIEVSAQQDPQTLSQAEVDAAWAEDVGDDELPVDDAETEGTGAQGAQGARDRS